MVGNIYISHIHIHICNPLGYDYAIKIKKKKPHKTKMKVKYEKMRKFLFIHLINFNYKIQQEWIMVLVEKYINDTSLILLSFIHCCQVYARYLLLCCYSYFGYNFDHQFFIYVHAAHRIGFLTYWLTYKL